MIASIYEQRKTVRFFGVGEAYRVLQSRLSASNDSLTPTTICWLCRRELILALSSSYAFWFPLAALTEKSLPNPNTMGWNLESSFMHIGIAGAHRPSLGVSYWAVRPFCVNRILSFDKILSEKCASTAMNCDFLAWPRKPHSLEMVSNSSGLCTSFSSYSWWSKQASIQWKSCLTCL